jgi:hypothetical protein
MLLRITGRDEYGRKFCAGIERGGACAPILRRHLKGKTLREIRAYCAEKERGWTVEIVGETDASQRRGEELVQEQRGDAGRHGAD